MIASPIAASAGPGQTRSECSQTRWGLPAVGGTTVAFQSTGIAPTLNNRRVVRSASSGETGASPSSAHKRCPRRSIENAGTVSRSATTARPSAGEINTETRISP